MLLKLHLVIPHAIVATEQTPIRAGTFGRFVTTLAAHACMYACNRVHATDAFSRCAPVLRGQLDRALNQRHDNFSDKWKCATNASSSTSARLFGIQNTNAILCDHDTHIRFVIGDSKVYIAASLASARIEAIFNPSFMRVWSCPIEGYASIDMASDPLASALCRWHGIKTVTRKVGLVESCPKTVKEYASNRSRQPCRLGEPR